MVLSRRVLLTGLFALVASSALAHTGRHRHPHRPGRRWVRRRRIRRRVRWRTVRGRRLLVVPLTLHIGTELLMDNDIVVVVREVHEHKIVVEHADGHTEEIEVEREDTEENTKDLEGSEYEVEVEEKAGD